MQLAGHVVLQRDWNQIALVAAASLRISSVEIHVGRDPVRVIKGLSDSYARFQTTDEGNDVSPIPFLVQIERKENIHF